MAKKPKCIVDGCKKPSKLRGCCHNHYHYVYRSIKAGAIASWSEAEKSGLAVSKKSKPGPKR